MSTTAPLLSRSQLHRTVITGALTLASIAAPPTYAQSRSYVDRIFQQKYQVDPATAHQQAVVGAWLGSLIAGSSSPTGNALDSRVTAKLGAVCLRFPSEVDSEPSRRQRLCQMQVLSFQDAYRDPLATERQLSDLAAYTRRIYADDLVSVQVLADPVRGPAIKQLVSATTKLLTLPATQQAEVVALLGFDPRGLPAELFAERADLVAVVAQIGEVLSKAAALRADLDAQDTAKRVQQERASSSAQAEQKRLEAERELHEADHRRLAERRNVLVKQGETTLKRIEDVDARIRYERSFLSAAGARSNPWRDEQIEIQLQRLGRERSELQRTAKRVAQELAELSAGSRSPPGVLDRESRLRLVSDISGQLHRCWKVPAAAQAASPPPVARIKLVLNTDGSAAAPATVLNPSGDALFIVAAASALQATERCLPLKIADEFRPAYREWREVVINFNPQSMGEQPR